MWRRTGGAAHVTVAVLSALILAAGKQQEVRVREVVQWEAAPSWENNTIVYDLAIVQEAGWRKQTVAQAVDQVEAIFEQCGVRVAAESVHWLEIPVDLHALEESAQQSLLAVLPQRRPMALFVNRTTEGDSAYSYLASAPVATRGTAWLTRNSHPACVGALLAHELGHILLDTARHSSNPGNLMSHTCTVSNVAGFRPGTNLTRSQCDTLRRLETRRAPGGETGMSVPGRGNAQGWHGSQ